MEVFWKYIFVRRSSSWVVTKSESGQRIPVVASVAAYKVYSLRLTILYVILPGELERAINGFRSATIEDSSFHTGRFAQLSRKLFGSLVTALLSLQPVTLLLDCDAYFISKHA